MSKATSATSANIVYLMAISLFSNSIATAQELKKGGKPSDTKPAAIIGAWKSVDRHVAIASLFQPEHGVRKREAVAQFTQDGDHVLGHVVAEDGQSGWKDNRTDFRKVTFADDRITFEFEITWRKGAGPLAVEAGRLENKGLVRVDAKLEKDRLAGTWKMYLADGTEVFRGEWEADRAKGPDKK